MRSVHWTVYSCGLLLFFTMARLGSVLPTSQDTKTKYLTRDCINFSTEGMLITLLHTKTIQFGLRRLHIPLVKLELILCPVSAYRKCLSFLKSPQRSAFRYRDTKSGGYSNLNKSLFIKIFREVLQSAGEEDPAGFTGHSFRRGGASWAFQSGIPGELIQVCGDWVSDAYKRYLEFSTKNKLEIAQKFARSLCNS